MSSYSIEAEVPVGETGRLMYAMMTCMQVIHMHLTGGKDLYACRHVHAGKPAGPPRSNVFPPSIAASATNNLHGAKAQLPTAQAPSRQDPGGFSILRLNQSAVRLLEQIFGRTCPDIWDFDRWASLSLHGKITQPLPGLCLLLMPRQGSVHLTGCCQCCRANAAGSPEQTPIHGGLCSRHQVAVRTCADSSTCCSTGAAASWPVSDDLSCFCGVWWGLSESRRLPAQAAPHRLACSRYCR